MREIEDVGRVEQEESVERRKDYVREEGVDTVDIALIGAFILTLVCILALTVLERQVPDYVFTIFWALALSLGLKKYPSTLGK